MGNEVVNVAISILAGTLAFEWMRRYEVRGIYLVSTIVTTIVLLIFGEIVPKNVAIRFPVILTQVLIIPYQIFAWVVSPLRLFFTKIADMVVRLFGADPRKGMRLIVEEELRSLLKMGKEEGTLADLERMLIQNALDFSRRRVTQAMTPRESIVAISAETSFPEILKILEKNHYSRLPVYEGELDRVIGILHAKELLSFRLPRESSQESIEPLPLKNILKAHVEVSAGEPLDLVFQKFQQNQIHMGIVRDEKGRILGLITMDDLLRRFFP